MTFQILAPLQTYPDGNSKYFAAQVANVAQHLKAEVHGVVVYPVFPQASAFMGEMIINVDGMALELTAKCHSTGAALLLSMQNELRTAKIQFRSTKYDCMIGLNGETLATEARYHDLTVMELTTKDVSAAETAETVVFSSGRPVLLVPPALPEPHFKHVVIGWDGSRVAARAAADANEFLKLAKTVTIVCVTDEKALTEDDPGKKLAAHLAHHNINAKIDLVQNKLWPIGETLQERALKIGADMMVMGAFGHSRMRDFVMGGATKGVLQNLKLPVLLSH